LKILKYFILEGFKTSPIFIKKGGRRKTKRNALKSC